MYHYTAYGLCIGSVLPLPELQTSSESKTDVEIKLGSINWTPPESSPGGRYFHLDGEEAYFYWEVVGKFLVRSGKEIIIEPLPNLDEHLVRLPLLGSVLAMLLHQRQHLVLHASAVAVNGNAAVFLGPKGQGKSTMAAILYSRGHKLMADDVAALEVGSEGSPVLLPGFPQIKLWPEAATAALGDDPETLRRIHPEVEKRARPTLDSFFPLPLSLKCIYVLCEGSTVELKQLKPQEAIVKLISNSYIPYLLGQKFLQSVQVPLHMRQCTNLAKILPIYSLERPRSLDLLPDVASLVEENLASKLQPAL